MYSTFESTVLYLLLTWLCAYAYAAGSVSGQNYQLKILSLIPVELPAEVHSPVIYDVSTDLSTDSPNDIK